MINNQYSLYIDSVMNLASTLAIKFTDVATAMNTQVMIDHGFAAVDQNDPASWKYYQNISGEYHFSDEMMRINSLDQSEVIDFTKENLEIHTETKAAYEYGSRYYRELILQNPEKELLILGILYPADIDVAIAAPEGKILTYPASFVESNELSLIPKLQDWINKYLFRWVNRQFSISDDLYVAAWLYQFYMYLTPVILNLRLEACKTNEAHSFHVRMYLGSHNYLDKYLGAMTKEQALFFYRNILYIQRYAGHRDTFDWLVENVMTVRGLSFFEYMMNHDLTAMARDASDLLETPLFLETWQERQDRLFHRSLPATSFKRNALNSLAIGGEGKNKDITTVLEKMNPLAPGNEDYLRFNGHEDDIRFRYSTSSVIATKLLESSVIDYSDVVSYKKADILLDHWISFVCSNLYTATVNLEVIKAETTVRLEAQQALALFFYLTMKSYEPEEPPIDYPYPLRVPTIRVGKALRLPRLTLTQLREGTLKADLDDTELQEIYDSSVAVSTMISVDLFYEQCMLIYEAHQKQRQICSNKQNMHKRAQAGYAVARLYADQTFRLTELSSPVSPYQGMLWTDLFDDIGLSFDGYSPEDYKNLAAKLLGAALGTDKRQGLTLKEIQDAMVKLFVQLSSYTVAVVSEIISTNIDLVPSPQIRIGDIKESTRSHDYVDPGIFEVITDRVTENYLTFLDVDCVFPLGAIHWNEIPVDRALGSPNISVSKEFTDKIPSQVNTNIRYRSQDVDQAIRDMPLHQRADIVDVYCATQDRGDAENHVIVGFRYVGRRKHIPLFNSYNLDEVLDVFPPLEASEMIVGFYYVGRRKHIQISESNDVINGFSLMNRAAFVTDEEFFRIDL